MMGNIKMKYHTDKELTHFLAEKNTLDSGRVVKNTDEEF